ncbi:MAG: helix-turn-helix transcriptional regulator [Bacteroidales bacterium]|nr:helix-turn-helix transcriptional regulator [Bacteroidales bacterium]
MMLSEKLKEHRKQCNLPQRKVATVLDFDTSTYCKIKNDNYSPKREQVIKLASVLNTDVEELFTLWLADQIQEITKSEKDIALKAIGIVLHIYINAL